MEIEPARGDLLDRLMSAANERAKVIADNVANQNTPGFQRRVLRFEELLGAAVRSGARDLARIEPELEVDSATPSRPDGNNVSMELELSAMRQNRLLFELYASIRSHQFELLRAGIESSR